MSFRVQLTAEAYTDLDRLMAWLEERSSSEAADRLSARMLAATGRGAAASIGVLVSGREGLAFQLRRARLTSSLVRWLVTDRRRSGAFCERPFEGLSPGTKLLFVNTRRHFFDGKVRISAEMFRFIDWLRRSVSLSWSRQEAFRRGRLLG